MSISRRQFLNTSATTGALLVPATVAGQSSSVQKSQPQLVLSSSGRRLWVLEILITMKLDSRMTAGAYSSYEDIVLPGRGVPLHVHTREDETIYVLEGNLRITIGDKTYAAQAGDFANMPRNLPHKFQNTGSKPARMLLSFTPGGFEQVFLEVGKPVTDTHEPPPITPADIKKTKDVAARYGAKWI